MERAKFRGGIQKKIGTQMAFQNESIFIYLLIQRCNLKTQFIDIYTQVLEHKITPSPSSRPKRSFGTNLICMESNEFKLNSKAVLVLHFSLMLNYLHLLKKNTNCPKKCSNKDNRYTPYLLSCKYTYVNIYTYGLRPYALTHLCPPLRSTFAVRETASLGIMGAPRVPPLNPSETKVLSEHYRL